MNLNFFKQLSSLAFILTFIFGLLFRLLFSIDSVSARIIETETITDLLDEINRETLILIDIDHTAVMPATALGSTAWFEYCREKLKRANVPSDKFADYTSKIFFHVPHRAVESCGPAFIRLLQDKGHFVWAFTGRLKKAPWDSKFDLTTKKHLNEAGIDFERSRIPAGIALDLKEPPCVFSYGVIFSNWTPKGPVLVSFLKEIGYRPSKIVMIDDQLDFLKSVEDSLAQENIPFTGYLYHRVRKMEQQFDPFIANIQLQVLMEKGTMLSDEAAGLIKIEMLKLDPYSNPHFYLDRMIAEQS